MMPLSKRSNERPASPAELCQDLALIGLTMRAARVAGDLAALRAARAAAFDTAMKLAWATLSAQERGEGLPLPTTFAADAPPLPLPRLTLDEANVLRQSIHADTPNALALIQAHPDGGFWLAVYRRHP